MGGSFPVMSRTLTLKAAFLVSLIFQSFWLPFWWHFLSFRRSNCVIDVSNGDSPFLWRPSTCINNCCLWLLWLCFVRRWHVSALYLFFWLTFFPLLPQCFLSLRRGFISICLVQSWAKISLLKWLDERSEKINELKWMKTAHKTSRRSLGRGRGLILWELQKENTSIFTSVHEAFSICQAKVHIPTWLWSLKPNQLWSQAALVWN